MTSLSSFSQTPENKVIRIYQGAARGSENWTWNESIMPKANVVYNVSSPTLTVFEADKSIATGKAVIICPGGGFIYLEVNNEGYDVAKWLNNKGITAFVLKYRLSHCETDNPKLEFMNRVKDNDKHNKEIVPIVDLAIADGKAAIAYVRSHASDWKLMSDQIGIMGFSAGGTVASGVAFTYDAQSRPDFVAPIYPYVGSYSKGAVPVDAPPMFIAVASNDGFGFNKSCIDLYNKWSDAKKMAELHIYRTGNHGFGMKKHNIPTDTWIDRFYEWLTYL